MDIEKMKALALAATPGPWTVCRHLESVQADKDCTCGYRGAIFGPDHFAPMAICQPGHDPDPVGEEGLGPQSYPRATQIADSQFIAAANPAAVLELIAEIELLCRERAMLARGFGEITTGSIELHAEVERLKNERDLFRLGHSNASNRCCELEVEVERLRAELEGTKPAAEPLRWEATTLFYTRFITNSRYQKMRPSFQKWYKPICEKCGAAPAAGTVEKDAERWIDLKDSKPRDGQRVLIALDTGTVVTGYRFSVGWEWDETESEADSMATATHWMCMPAAPGAAIEAHTKARKEQP